MWYYHYCSQHTATIILPPVQEASYGKSETTAQSNGSSQQIVPQQPGTAGFDRAVQETEAAKAAAGKINVSKAELEETARHVEELQSKVYLQKNILCY